MKFDILEAIDQLIEMFGDSAQIRIHKLSPVYVITISAFKGDKLYQKRVNFVKTNTDTDTNTDDRLYYLFKGAVQELKHHLDNLPATPGGENNVL